MTSEPQDCLRKNGREQGIIGLCVKTYYCFGAKDKFSGKGINKKCNDTNKEKYLNVLLTKQNSTGVNRSFRVTCK